MIWHILACLYYPSRYDVIPCARIIRLHQRTNNNTHMNIKMPNDPPNTTNMPMAVSEKAISEYLEARNLPAATQGNILSAVKEAIIKIATSGHADWDTIIDNNTILSCSPCMVKEAKKSLGWSYVRLPEEIRKAMKLVRDKIDIDDLGEDGKEGHPHITAKYGLTVKNPEEVKNATIGNRGGKVRMGKTSLFENEDCDVLKVSVTSHALHALWKSLSELPNEDKHDEYIPHATLAYLKKGTGKKYRNLDDLDGMEFVFDAFVFQDADDVETEIVLDGKTSEASVDRIQVRTAQFDEEEDLSWMGEVQQEQERKSTLLQDKINRQRFFVETYDWLDESWVKMSSITVEEGAISGEFTSQEEAQKAINQHADKGNYPMSLFRIVSTEFGPLTDEKPELFYIQELRDNEWKRIDLRLDENDARQMIEYYKKRRARSSETADVRIVSSKRGVLDSTSEQQTTEDAEEIQLATNPRAVPLGIPSRPTESFLANMEHGRTYAWEFKRNTRHYRNGNPTEGRFDRQRSGHILSFSPINNAVVGVDEDATFWIDSRSIRRIWPVRTSVSSVNKKILTSQFLDDENDFEIAIHELEPPVQPSSDATTADNTTPDRSESDGAIAIDGENFYPPFSPQFQDSDGEWLDISSMTFQNPLEALWDANAYAASTNTRVRVVDSRGGEFVPSLEHSFSSEYINVNNHPDITGEHEYTLRNNRTSVWSNLVYQTYDEAQISKQRMGGDWRIVPCKHQIEARVRLSPTAPYQEWEDAGFEDDNGNTFLFSHLSEALSAIQDFRANHHGANLVDFRVIPIPLNHIVTNAKTKSSIKKAQFEDEDDFEIAIHELEPFSYSSPKKDAQPRMPSGSYKRGTEIFELLKNTGGTDWEPIGSSDNLQDAAMVVNSAVSRGDSFFDYGVSSSFVGPVPLFMIQKKNGNNEMEGTDNPIVFATRPKAKQALDELYGDGYHIISTYADDPRNNTSRFLVKQLTPQGWVSAWSIASSYASFNDAWKDIQECMFHRPENMFMVIDAEYDCPVRINPPQQINIYWQNSKGSWELAHRYSDMQEARERFTALRNNNPSSHYSVEIIPSETQSREASQQGLRKQAQFEDDDSFNISFLQEAEQEFQERTMLFNREKFQIQCRTDHGWITPEDGIKNLFFNEQDARKAVPQFVQQMFPQGRTSSNIDKFRIFGSRQGVIPLTLFKVTFSTKNIHQIPVTLNFGNFLTKEKAQQAIEDHKARFKRLPDTYKIVEGTTSDNWPVVDGSDGEPEKFFVQYAKKQEVYKFVEQDGKPQEFPSKEQAFKKQFELLKTNKPPYATRIISSLTGLGDNRDASTNQTDRIEFTGPYILESWYDANITPGNRWVASRERYEEPDQAWGAAANIVRSTNARATGFRVKDSRNNLLPRPPFFGEQDPPNVANPWVVQYKTPDAPSSAAWNTLQECSTQEEARNVMTSRSRLDSYMVFRLVNTDGPVPRVIDQTTSSVSGHYFPKVLDALSNGFVLLEGDENRTYHTEEAAWAGAKQWMRNRGLNPDATSIMVIGPGGSTHIIPPEHWNDNNETNEPRPTRLTPANLEQQGRRIFDRFENSAFGRQTMIDAAASINDEAKLTFLTLNFATWYRRERQEDEPVAYRIMPYIRSILRTIVASQSSTQSNN